MKTLVSSLALALVLVGQTATADQVMVIDDDGVYYTEAPAPLDFVVDIDDDGFTVSPRTVVPASSFAFATADCTQLELAAGLDAGACGTVSNAELAQTFIGLYD